MGEFEQRGEFLKIMPGQLKDTRRGVVGIRVHLVVPTFKLVPLIPLDVRQHLVARPCSFSPMRFPTYQGPDHPYPTTLAVIKHIGVFACGGTRAKRRS